jgi:tetraacyldisaccharide 4'-kinase
VLTAEEVLHGDWLLPAGRRREPVSSLYRADIMLISRCSSKQEFEEAQAKLARFQKTIVGIGTEIVSMKHLGSEQHIPLEDLRGKRVLAVSGIGSPRSFEQVLEHAGAVVVRHMAFSDHHWYTPRDVLRIQEEIRSHNVAWAVTTEKDTVKLQSLQDDPAWGSVPFVTVGIRQHFLAGEEQFQQTVHSWIGLTKQYALRNYGHPAGRCI